MIHFIKVVVEYIAYIAEGIAAFIILVGTLRTLWSYLRSCFIANEECRATINSRIKLGHSLSLGLEFLIGADILKTAIAPSWSDIGQLAAIVAIRTVLNFFLMKELNSEEKLLLSQKKS
jgi:uncharacterized membrane protein